MERGPTLALVQNIALGVKRGGEYVDSWGSPFLTNAAIHQRIQGPFVVLERKAAQMIRSEIVLYRNVDCYWEDVIGATPFPKLNCKVKEGHGAGTPLLVDVVKGRCVVCGPLHSFPLKESAESVEGLEYSHKFELVDM